MKNIVTIFICIFFLLGCGQKPEYFERKMSSGKIIKIKTFRIITFKDGEETLFLEYQTDLDFNTSHDLKNEMEEIWKDVQTHPSIQNHKYAGILALSEMNGLIYKTGNFASITYAKISTGEWIRQRAKDKGLYKKGMKKSATEKQYVRIFNRQFIF